MSERTYKVGSLFDGSGGFPLAGSLCGIEPVWAAEVEPYPIAVTRSRFPHMKHLGDVTKVNGADIEPVDIITFGSPCQDLSVAGKRAGLKHEANGDDETTRSGLFMEAIRIIKEMRGATNGIYPRFAVWENVFGAFSSNRGEDFRIVLEELIKIVEPSASMPAPEKGRWPYADCYVGDGWSVAYRTFDAKYWGVPQRRRRIYLVADFGGECAWKILFEREGLRGYFETGRTPWKGTASDAERGVGAADSEGDCIEEQASIGVCYAAGFKAGQDSKARSNGFGYEKCPTLSAEAGGNSVPSVCVKVQYLFENHSQDTRYTGPVDTAPTVSANYGMGGNNQPIVCKPVFCLQGNGIDRADTAGCNGKCVKEDISYTLNTIDRHCVAFAVQSIGDYKQSDVSSTLKSRDYKGDADLAVECAGVYCRNMNGTVELYPTLQAKPNGGQSLNFSGAVRVGYTVRRLTPTECARLQGFPDNWGHPIRKADFSGDEYNFWLNVRNTYAAINGKAVRQYTRQQMLSWYNKLHTDSAEYKMWGNGIALPCALYVMQGIQYVLNGGDAQKKHTKW